MKETVSLLRRRLAALEPVPARRGGEAFGLGLTLIDDALAGGLARGGLHEIFPAEAADATAATGFGIGLALRAMAGTGSMAWIRQAFAETEAGRLHAPGLAAFGLDPSRLILVRARDIVGVLRAGVEAARCSGLDVALVEPWGHHRALDLTATRRLALAAEKSGVTIILMRLGSEAQASAALTRWQVSASASAPLAANAPGHPVFDVTLLRHRAGLSGMRWRLEWDHEHHVFRQAAPLSGAVVSVSPRRPASAQIVPLARAG